LLKKIVSLDATFEVEVGNLAWNSVEIQ